MSEAIEVMQDEREVDVADLESGQSEGAEEAQAADDADVEESETSESDAQDEPQEKPKRRSRAQERINELTREKYDLQRMAEEATRRAQAYEQYFRQNQQPQMPAGDMPKLADYDYDEGRYQQAVAQWSQANVQAVAQHQADIQRQAAHQAEVESRNVRVMDSVRRAQQEFPDFLTVVQDPTLPPLNQVNPAAFEALLEHDAMPKIAYHLAKNPQEIYAFQGLSPTKAAMRIAELGAELKGPPGQQKSAAIKPPPKLPGGAATATKDPSTLSTEEYIEWRNRNDPKLKR